MLEEGSRMYEELDIEIPSFISSIKWKERRAITQFFCRNQGNRGLKLHMYFGLKILTKMEMLFTNELSVF